MKKAVAIAATVLCLAFLSGCATPYPIGALYMDVKLPMTVTSNDIAGKKVGRAQCKSVLGMVAIGDASIEAAKKDGGITKVTHVDWEVDSVLGIVGKYRCVVYGE